MLAILLVLQASIGLQYPLFISRTYLYSIKKSLAALSEDIFFLLEKFKSVVVVLDERHKLSEDSLDKTIVDFDKYITN